MDEQQQLAAQTRQSLQQQHFDKVGSSASMRQNRPLARRLSIVHEMLGRVEPGRLLDVGCSNGAITATFARHELYGIDVSPVSVREAQSRGIQARVGDLEQQFPFENGKFDVVFAGEIIEHTIRTDFFLSECNRVLAKDGTLIITTPNVNSIASLFTMYLLDIGPYMGARYRSPHVRDFSVRTLTHAFRQNGFEPQEVRGTWLGLPWPSGIERLVGPVDSNVAYVAPRCASGLVALAQKRHDVRYDAGSEIEETLAI